MKRYLLIAIAIIFAGPLFSQGRINYIDVAKIGGTKSICIYKGLANEDTLTIFAEQIQQDNRRELSTIIYVFDDFEAAKLYARHNHLNDTEKQYYDSHLVAIYWKKPGYGGRHDFTIMLDGVNGEKQVIKAEEAKKLAEAARKKIMAENKNTQAATNTIESKPKSESTDLSEMFAAVFFLAIIFGIQFSILAILLKIKKKSPDNTRLDGWLNFVVCLFWGFIGVHKFRAKKIGLGILYLFTLGIFLFGWGIDIIIYFVKAIRKNSTQIDLENDAQLPLELADTDELPVAAEHHVVLKKNEICHFFGPSIHIKIKNVVTGSQRSGGGSSVRLLKGVYLHSGKSQASTVRGDIMEKSEGIFAVTNQRLIFSSAKISFEKKYSDLSALTQNEYGLLFQFGDKHYLLALENPKYIYQIIARIINSQEDEWICGKFRFNDLDLGRIIGLQQREHKKAIETARALFTLGVVTPEQIAQTTGLPLAEVQKIAAEMSAST